MPNHVKYSRIETTPDVDLEAPTASRPKTFSNMFHRGGTANVLGGPGSQASGSPTSKQAGLRSKLHRVNKQNPVIGSVLAVATVAAATASAHAPLIMGGVGIAAVTGTGMALSRTTTAIEGIGNVVQSGIADISAMTVDKNGMSYIQSAGEGVTTATEVLKKIDASGVVDNLSSLDLTSLNTVLLKLQKIDVDQAVSKITKLVDAFDKLTVSADLHFITNTDNELGSVDTSDTGLRTKPNASKLASSQRQLSIKSNARDGGLTDSVVARGP